MILFLCIHIFCSFRSPRICPHPRMHISRVLKRMAKGCGTEYVTLHGLRHTYGTVLKNRGVNVYDISKVLGHSDIKVTADIYIHDDVEALRRAIGSDMKK